MSTERKMTRLAHAWLTLAARRWTRSVIRVGLEACCAAWLAMILAALPAEAQPRIETPAEIVQRATAAHGNGPGAVSISDSVSNGKLTVYSTAGPKATFDVSIIRRGVAQAQRLISTGAGIRQGTDGAVTWDSHGGFSTRAQGASLSFIEGVTVRSVQALFEHASRGAVLRDGGAKDSSKVVELEDRDGRRTRFSIDDASSTVTRIDMVVGQSRDAFSHRLSEKVESWVFSDFRRVQGILTPFKTERWLGGVKLEQIDLSDVRYNQSVQGSVFRP